MDPRPSSKPEKESCDTSKTCTKQNKPGEMPNGCYICGDLTAARCSVCDLPMCQVCTRYAKDRNTPRCLIHRNPALLKIEPPDLETENLREAIRGYKEQIHAATGCEDCQDEGNCDLENAIDCLIRTRNALSDALDELPGEIQDSGATFPDLPADMTVAEAIKEIIDQIVG